MPDGGGSVGSSLRGGERNVSSTVVNLALGSFETDCPGASSGPDVVFCRCLGHPTGTLLTPRVLLNCYSRLDRGMARHWNSSWHSPDSRGPMCRTVEIYLYLGKSVESMALGQFFCILPFEHDSLL